MTVLFKDSGYSKIHFIAVCGTAMASVAAELHRAGFEVSGSDAGVYPPMSNFLENQGVKVIEGFRPENLPSDALIVVGNAVSRGNPELEAALNLNCSLISLPELISRRYLTDKCSVVVVAGTHGKTTTTAMIAHILKFAGRDPGWMIGGIPLDLDVPCWRGEGEEFVIEGDEYDSVYWDKRPKFYHYRPRMAVLTSIEFDHSDIYSNFAAIEAVFERFVRLLPENGKLIVFGDDQRAVTVANRSFSKVETYGSLSGCNWQVRDRTNAGETGLTGEFTGPAGLSGTISLQMLGEHNLYNALAALAVAVQTGVDPQTALEALECFRGVKRRLEMVVETRQNTVWEDFAHHPTAITSTLEGLKLRYPEQRLWALLEPRSNTMARNYFRDELIEALTAADRVIIGPIHRKNMIPADELLNTQRLADDLKSRGTSTNVTETFAEIVEIIRADLKPDDVIVIMSNGGFGGIKDKIVALVESE